LLCRLLILVPILLIISVLLCFLSSSDYDDYQNVAPLRAKPAVGKSRPDSVDQERVIPEAGCQKSATASRSGQGARVRDQKRQHG
jgi:hypothetical protein